MHTSVRQESIYNPSFNLCLLQQSTKIEELEELIDPPTIWDIWFMQHSEMR